MFNPLLPLSRFSTPHEFQVALEELTELPYPDHVKNLVLGACGQMKAEHHEFMEVLAQHAPMTWSTNKGNQTLDVMVKWVGLHQKTQALDRLVERMSTEPEVDQKIFWSNLQDRLRDLTPSQERNNLYTWMITSPLVLEKGFKRTCWSSVFALPPKSQKPSWKHAMWEHLRQTLTPEEAMDALFWIGHSKSHYPHPTRAKLRAEKAWLGMLEQRPPQWYVAWEKLWESKTPRFQELLNKYCPTAYPIIEKHLLTEHVVYPTMSSKIKKM